MYNPLSPETIKQIKSDLSAGASWKFIENKYLTTKYMVKQYLGNDYNPRCIGRPKMVLNDTVKNCIVLKKVECGVGYSILTQIIRRDHSNDTVMENLPPGSKISYRQVYKTIKDVSIIKLIQVVIKVVLQDMKLSIVMQFGIAMYTFFTMTRRVLSLLL